MNWPGDTRPLYVRVLEARDVRRRFLRWRRLGAHADPFNRAMVDAIREALGLDPLYEADETRASRKKTVEERDRERFASHVYIWPAGAP